MLKDYSIKLGLRILFIVYQKKCLLSLGEGCYYLWYYTYEQSY